MQVEIRCRTQEAPSVPDMSERMLVTELGHVKDKIPGHSVGSTFIGSAGRYQVGQSNLPICNRGVLSGILLRGWESQLQGEGPDGST